MFQFRAAALLVLTVVLTVGCSSRSDDPAAEGRTATLRILEGSVEVSSEGDGFSPGQDGQVLGTGDVVRTATGGRAAIEWFDGSVTRLERDTTYTLTVIEELTAGGVVIEGEQSSGSTYHRVTTLTEAASRFDVVTPTATASVQGTIFAVIFNEDGTTAFAVFEGTVLVGEAQVPVPAGFMVVVAADGTVGDPVPIPDELLEADWILYNQCELDGALDCEEAALDRIELSPSQATITAGDSQAYVVEAFDSEGESLGDVTAMATIAGPGCTAASCAPTEAGEHTITAEYQGLSAGATLTVISGETGSLRLVPESATAPAGVPQMFTALGFDSHGNPTGSVDAVFSIPGGSCDGGSCSTTTAGEHVVTATFGGVSGTATLTVDPGSLSYIVISPATAAIVAGETQEYIARGYDAHGNLRGTVSASYDIDEGSCEANACTSTAPGERLVTGTHSGRSDTAVLTVVAGPPGAIILEHLGEVVTEEIAVGSGFGDSVGGDSFVGGLVIGCEAHSFRATVTDAYGNPLDFGGVVLFGDVDGGEFANVGFVTGTENPQFGVVAVNATNGVAEVVIIGWADGSVTLQASLDESVMSNSVGFAVSGGCSQLD